MRKENTSPEHPGVYVKKRVLPEGITVKKAAELMGIGRPALSNFLNGKANLSQGMATRLEKAFGVDKAKLLKIQQEHTAYLNKENESRIAVRSYAPSFLDIRAIHISTWAERIETRALLAALLRRLVNTTGSDIESTNFPAHDNSQRHGWDGQVVSRNVTPWVPEGISGWEFGCDKDPRQKANTDYTNRTKSVSAAEREKTTFIFVTPHNWPKKDEWVQSKKGDPKWKDVRALDANDLEQWLELSGPGQVWLAQKIGIERNGCQSLDDYWTYWSESSDPSISRKLFNGAVTAHGEVIKKWFQSPSKKPLVITAGSKEEALAFIACASHSVPALKEFSEQAILVSNPDSARKLAAISADFIPIVHTDKAEAVLVESFKSRHSIVVTEKNFKGAQPDIIIDLPDYESFREALTEMGFNDVQIEIHSNQSGNSPTILRRQLASVPSLRRSHWAIDNSRARLMVPLVLAGTWKSDQSGDKEILSSLSEVDYPEIEKSVADLASGDDAPIWSEGKFCGVVSKLDCFQAISDQITANDLDKFFFVAEYVLSEDDPALDLDKADRWAANLYSKVRDHSSAIRESISETLIILSVHGDGLFGSRLGIQIQFRVDRLICELLKGKSERVWQSQQGDLPRYAEAAPEVFLDIVESELQNEVPAFAPLFESVDGGMFSRCERTGMLWALELLAWNPSWLARVVMVLAKLCAYKLEDNWSNKPIRSLSDIFLSWRPHTMASFSQRCDVLELLCKKYHDVGWNICFRQIKPGSSVTSGTYRPHWRNDASGFGQNLTRKEFSDFNNKCLNLMLSWSSYTSNNLADLVSCMAGLSEENQAEIVALIQNWYDSSPTDEEVVKLREHVRRKTLTYHVRRRKEFNAEGYAIGIEIYDMLMPKDIVFKHQWLFANQWVEYSPEELICEELSHDAREKRLSSQRVAALKEVYGDRGLDGLINLCLNGEAGFTIGWHLSQDIMGNKELQELVLKSLILGAKEYRYRVDACISGVLFQLTDEICIAFLRDLINKILKDALGSKYIVCLFRNARFKEPTWDLLQQQNSKTIKEYWRQVTPRWDHQTSVELNFVVDQLLEVNRPRAAFSLINLKPSQIESSRLVSLLKTVAIDNSEPIDQYPVEPYNIEKALKSLNMRHDLNRMDLVELEFLFVQMLSTNLKYDFPNLSIEVSESPLMFMQMIALCYRRDDGGKDPAEWQLPDEPDQRKNVAQSAHDVLERVRAIPGSQSDGSIDIDFMREWIFEVRSLGEESGRAGITDQRIGQLLSNSGDDEDGMWPRKEIREVLEECASKDISIGLEIGLRNSNSFSFRGDGGGSEHSMASNYSRMAESVMNEFPFVGRMLFSIADSYKHEASWWDAEDRVRKRIHN